MIGVHASENWVPCTTRNLIADGKLAIGDGYRAKNSELSGEGLPFARAGNINSGFHFMDADRFPVNEIAKVGDKVSQPGDVVFTSKGTVGRLALVRLTTPRFVYSPQLCYWRSLDQEAIDSRWLYFWMHGGEFGYQVAGLKGQTDMADYVSLSDQRNMEISLPPIAEQRAIAGVLGALDDKIEQNRRTAQALEKLARAIFRAWFVDYEPVKAKAAGATGFPSMPQSVFDALPTRFVDSAIGPVPEGWEVKAVNDLCDYISSGGTPARRRPEFWANGTIDWFKTGELQDGPLLVSSERITEKGLDNSSAKLWPSGTVLFALYASPTVGRLGVLTRPGTSNQAAAGLIAKSEVGVPFLMNALIEARAELQRIAVGAAQQNINQGVLKSHQMVLPPSELTRAYSGAMNSALEMRIALAEEAAKLSELRDYLLPKLLSGQVRVRDAERKAASVA